MKNRNYKPGLTLVEMLIVAVVVAILATMVVGIAGRIDNQAKEKGIKSIFALLESALQEYHEYKGGFPRTERKEFYKRGPAFGVSLGGALLDTRLSEDIGENQRFFHKEQIRGC